MMTTAAAATTAAVKLYLVTNTTSTTARSAISMMLMRGALLRRHHHHLPVTSSSYLSSKASNRTLTTTTVILPWSQRNATSKNATRRMIPTTIRGTATLTMPIATTTTTTTAIPPTTAIAAAAKSPRLLFRDGMSHTTYESTSMVQRELSQQPWRLSRPWLLYYHQPSWLPQLGGASAAMVMLLLGGCAVGQYYYGHQQDFFEYRFILDNNKNSDSNENEIDPDDLASFYGGEEFMELFCVVPFMGTLMMRGGHFDEEGTVHTTGFPGTMQVSMVFSDETDDTDGKTKWFNKRERFRDVLFGYTCWDMVTNFGFQRLDDGSIMVYHHGEYFTSRFPPFSLLARLIFGLHARWVAWATEHYLHHYAFRDYSDNEQDEALEEQARTDMPLFLLTHYGPSDLMNLLFGSRGSNNNSTAAQKPSFLLRRSADEAKARQVIDDELTRLLPVYTPRIQRHITMDIQQDRANARSALVVSRRTSQTLVQQQVETSRHHHRHDDDEQQQQQQPQEINASTTASTMTTEIPLHIGLRRTATLTRRMTKMADDNEDDDDDSVVPLNEHERSNIGLGRQHKGGSAAWESVRATNDPKAYQAVTLAARERQLQRKVTISLIGPATTSEARDDNNNNNNNNDDTTGPTTAAR